MKKRLLALSMILAGALALTGCGKGKESEKKTEDNELQKIEQLNIAFSPYADSDTIMTATEPLEDLLKDKLSEKGYEVEKINMTVGTSYSAVGEALSAGTADVGFISSATYVLYDQDCQALLTALRYAITKDSTNPMDWNDGMLEENTDEMSAYYRSILLTGPSEKGQKLLAKVEAGEELTWEDLNDATWAVMSPASASGYIYPSLWLNERFGKGVSDLEHVVESDSYTTALARLATQQADIMVSYGHVRTKYASDWTTTLGGTDEMLKQTGVIGVTDKIFNDTISYSKNSEIMDEDFCQAIGEAFIEIGESEEGKEIISVFSQVGYQWSNDKDYDDERKAQELLKSLQ